MLKSNLKTNKKPPPPPRFFYFLNLVFCSVIMVSIFGTLWFFLLPFKNISSWFMCTGIRFLLKTQLWFPKDTNLSPKILNGIIISNHRSVLDTFILLATIPNLKVLSKKKLFSIPFLGQLMSISGQIPIDVKDSSSIELALKKIKAQYEKGYPILIYPELTRCPYAFKGIQKFSSFPFHFVFKHKIPITPVTLEETDIIWPKGRLALCKHQSLKIEFLTNILPHSFSSPLELKKQTWEIMNKKVLSLSNDH